MKTHPPLPTPTHPLPTHPPPTLPTPTRPSHLQAKGCQIVVKRGKQEVWEGRVESLRRIKEIVKEVKEGLECGIGSDFSLWKEGDKIEAFGARAQAGRETGIRRKRTHGREIAGGETMHPNTFVAEPPACLARKDMLFLW